MSLVKLEPDTVNDCSDDGELTADAIKVFNKPVCVILGPPTEATLPVKLIEEGPPVPVPAEAFQP